jgi:hypothetical protein
VSADSRTANQIDHILISNRFRSAITDIRALWGPDIGSDQNLLKINFKVKLRVKTGNKYNEKRKMVTIFQNPKLKQEYAMEINNKFKILENLDDEDSIDNNINRKLENIKTILKETKKQLIEKDKGIETPKNKWYDEECKFAIEEMKKAREKWLIKGRREKEELDYHHKRKEASKIIRNKKKMYIKNVTESTEEDQKHNNTRKMYQTVKQFKKGYQNKFSIIRNKKGELAMNIKEKAKIWKEYFYKLLNTEEVMELITKGNYEISEVEVEVEDLTIEDVKKAIRYLKNNEVAGTDGIHLELIK